MQDSALLKTGIHLTFRREIAPMWVRGVRSKKSVCIYFMHSDSCVLDFYGVKKKTTICNRNQNGAKLKNYAQNPFKVGVEYLFCL